VRLFVCGCVCEIEGIDLHRTGFVAKGNDHLLIWPSSAPGKEYAAGRKFWLRLLQPAGSVCISLSSFVVSGIDTQ